MTYFRTGNPYYHRRAAVSRSCSGWEGVGPAGYGRQALTRSQKSEIGSQQRRPRAAGVVALGAPQASCALTCPERLTSDH